MESQREMVLASVMRDNQKDVTPLRQYQGPDLTSTIREVLIDATDIVPHGCEPYVGWSIVLAERIAQAIEPRSAA